MKKLFIIKPFVSIDKFIEIEGPELSIKIDFDDVNRKETAKNLRKMVKILNESWAKQNKLNKKSRSFAHDT